MTKLTFVTYFQHRWTESKYVPKTIPGGFITVRKQQCSSASGNNVGYFTWEIKPLEIAEWWGAHCVDGKVILWVVLAPIFHSTRQVQHNLLNIKKSNEYGSSYTKRAVCVNGLVSSKVHKVPLWTQIDAEAFYSFLWFLSIFTVHCSWTLERLPSSDFPSLLLWKQRAAWSGFLF